ncbi:DNA-directed RNA polymerase, mitochondrial [Babesia microti strain RI]|uniref:DNA-directed RNA polymerase n=1 Tax=Babesia microti (strain RI) TaxID=1133968 RepID=I7ISY9_BABMR|nr:DNA-directed RNA polymerase, mitochondrial [Babesia microti strain RI]CCF75976.1 DNA-directed RNA polymerase, mitochondrial [Babesia microti strain RI]|eukprot:XP_012650384.1 DNA-directed RNA polymerase, mitochondrial [Babesia microti strain RI]
MFGNSRVRPILRVVQRFNISSAQIVSNNTNNALLQFLQPNVHQHTPSNTINQFEMQYGGELNNFIDERISPRLAHFSLETPNHILRPEPILLENISLNYLREHITTIAQPVLEWLRTDNPRLANLLDPRVKLFFTKVAEYTAHYGLLLEDILSQELINHVSLLTNFKDLFSLAYINEQKRLLYGDNSFPILINQRESHHFLQLKRQILIEKLSHLESLNRANENAFNIISMHKAADVKALSTLCNSWVSGMSKFITNCSKCDGEDYVFMDGAKYELVKDICETLNLSFLCQITINVVLQTVCIPTYHNNTSYQTKSNKFVPKSNQTLVTNAALKIGDDIINNYSNVKGYILHYKAETIANIGGFFLYALVKTAKIGVPGDVAKLQLQVELNAFLNHLKSKIIKSNGNEVEFQQTIDNLGINDDANNNELQNKLSDLCKKYKTKFPGLPEQWAIESMANDFDKCVYISSFTHSLERFYGKTFGVIGIRDCCWSYIKDTIAKSLHTQSYLPMVIEPRPWTKYNKGGCYSSKAIFIRTPTGSYCDYSVYDFTRVFNIVNAISRVPWKINTRMLKLISLAWDSSSARLNLWPHLPIKSKISLLPDDLNEIENIKMYAKDPKVVEFQNARLSTETPLLQRRLSIAKEFSNAAEIYFPHNIDFRGRLYPMSSHLNHMGDDLCRSLLLFARGKPLGDRGLFWLKIHIANLFGQDKIQFQHRLDWVEDNIKNFERLVKIFNPSLIDIPTKLLEDDVWNFWISADDPWQAYSAITELLNALKLDDPEEYISCIPIQQDGSCNGLQHYAALGRDYNGGSAVNLTPSDSPQDVYSTVLQAVIEKVQNDNVIGEKDYEISAKCVQLGLLKRKVVKQTVMTICYGVTRSGAVEQIKRQIIELYPSQMQIEEVHSLSQYIADKILSSINKVFKEAMKIKRWLDKISLAHNSLGIPINWLSPIGLPCHQPYSKYTKMHVVSPLQCLNISDPDPDNPDKQKQKLAFPPNFIHSLDATHLMMTAEALLINDKRLCNFAAVHDSYWALPSDVDTMNVAIREEFVKLYRQPILKNLYQFCSDRLGYLGNELIPEPPEIGSLDIDAVTKSKYFFH